MTISANIILIILFTGLTILGFLALANVYHALRFARRTTMTVVTSGTFIAGIAIILWFAAAFLVSVNWRGSFDVTIPTINFTSTNQ